MAEIVRSEERITKITVNRTSGAAEPRTALRVTTQVNSDPGDDVSMVRNFMQALTAAGAPDIAGVGYEQVDGRFNGLYARWVRVVDASDEAAQ